MVSINNKLIARIFSKTNLVVVLFLCFIQISFGQKFNAKEVQGEINDCPYVFYQDDKVIVKWVENNFIKEKVFSVEAFKDFQVTSCKEFKTSYLKIKPDEIINNEQKYQGVSKIAILSDIHGQHDLLIKLLKTHNIINEKAAWDYGSGHFVIVGDIFDRGDKVTETLWFIYNLEQQAALQGGKVHYLLGNHEIMTLAGNEKYLNNKYRWVSKGMGVSYKELFSAETLLGSWIRTKPVAITINDIAFAHAGFSPEFIDQDISINDINELFHNDIIDVEKETILENEEIKFLTKKNGPIWYRGYFKDQNFTKDTALQILEAIDISHIVVGHTSMEHVQSHFDGLIYSVDSSMKNGENAEILLWEDGAFFRGTLNGIKVKI